MSWFRRRLPPTVAEPVVVHSGDTVVFRLLGRWTAAQVNEWRELEQVCLPTVKVHVIVGTSVEIAALIEGP